MISGLCIVLALAAAAAPAPASPFEQVVAAEKAFAAASERDGYHAAFAAAFVEHGVVFDPVPVSAREKHAGKPRANATLAWGPAWAAVSTAGDLGFTSGPWEYRAAGEGAPPASTGWFFTAWRKQADGTWKVEADLGVTASLKYAAPVEVENALAVPPPPTTRPSVSATARYHITHAEHVLQFHGKDGLGAAVSAVADPAIRVYRDGQLPAGDPDGAQKLLAADARKANCGLAQVIGSASGDLGYAYGTCRPVDGQDAKKFGFLRVWRRQPDGTWRVFVDVTP